MKKRKDYLHISLPVITKDEISAVTEVLKSGWLTTGKFNFKLEDELKKKTGAKYAVALNSCTAALHIALKCLGVGKGDEVITTPFTFVATANAIDSCGAKPVFADIDGATGLIDPEKIEKAVTKKTKVILPVDYAGQPCDYGKINKIAKKYKLKVVQDAAHSIGAKYKNKNVGVLSDITCFSFYATKNITTGEGGALVTNNKNVYEKAMRLRLHGITKDAWKRYSKDGSWRYDVDSPGFKYNLADTAAALGVVQLKKLNEFNSRRRVLFNYYSNKIKNLKEIVPLKINEDVLSSHHLFPVRVVSEKIKRDALIEKLKKYNIGAAVHFIPVHFFSYYKNKYKIKKETLKNTEKLFSSILSLPFWHGIKKEDIDYTVDALFEIFKCK